MTPVRGPRRWSDIDPAFRQVADLNRLEHAARQLAELVDDVSVELAEHERQAAERERLARLERAKARRR